MRGPSPRNMTCQKQRRRGDLRPEGRPDNMGAAGLDTPALLLMLATSATTPSRAICCRCILFRRGQLCFLARGVQLGANSGVLIPGHGPTTRSPPSMTCMAAVPLAALRFGLLWRSSWVSAESMMRPPVWAGRHLVFHAREPSRSFWSGTAMEAML